MNQYWQRYWNEMRQYGRFLPLSPLVALIFFLLNWNYWREQGRVWAGFGMSLLLGTAIGLMIGLVFGAVYAVLTWIAIRTGKFRQPPIFVQILMGSFGALAGMWLVRFIRSFWKSEAETSLPFLSVLLFSGMIATAFSLYFAYRQAREDSLALRAESAEARYRTLENQMRPHFLFNALNSLAELIESGREDAAETTYKLSELYRQILANSALKTASLSSELAIARTYLELEQLRFGHRLRFEIRAPESNGAGDGIFLPGLMLQTLVENAVKHGIAPSLEGGQIVIEISRNSGDGYLLNVENSGAALNAQFSNEKGNGTGLANTRARLDLLYGNRHGFELRSDEQGRTVASFRFTGEKID